MQQAELKEVQQESLRGHEADRGGQTELSTRDAARAKSSASSALSYGCYFPSVSWYLSTPCDSECLRPYTLVLKLKITVSNNLSNL